MFGPDPQDIAARRMCGSALLIHLRWAAVLDRLALPKSRPREAASGVVSFPAGILRRAIARLPAR